MSKTAARLAIALALVGLGASLAAAYVHFQLLRNPDYSSFCDVSTIVNCTEVYSSRFSTVGGISVAVIGAIWFALASLLAYVAAVGPLDIRSRAHGYIFVGSTASLAVILYLGYASFAVLHAVCVLCVITYVAVIGLFLVTGSSREMRISSLPAHVLGDLGAIVSNPKALAFAVLFVAGSAAALLFFPRQAGSVISAADSAQTETDERRQFAIWYAAQPRAALDVPANGAAVVVVKFNDYQCPPCRNTYMAYKDLFEKYNTEQPGAVRFVLKDFPLETECNVQLTSDLHPAGCEAAVAVRLARERGKDHELEEWLFANQPSMTPELVKQGARDVAGVTDFDARYAATIELVKADIAYGRTLGVRATPTFFINGVMIQGGLPLPLFDQAIQSELQRAATTP